MKRIKKIWGIILTVCFVSMGFNIVSYASSASVSISSATGKVGSNVTVNCKVTCSPEAIGTADVILTYDVKKLEFVSGSGGYSLTGGSGSVVYNGVTSDGTSSSLSFSITFKIIGDGSADIRCTSATILNIDEAQVDSVSKGSATITCKAETTPPPADDPAPDNSSTPDNPSTTDKPDNKKDSNSKLKSLKVSVGLLSPAFNASTERYSVTVAGDVKAITISAAPQKSTSKVTVYGGKDLQIGDNEAKIVVMAEDGSTTVYYITITRGELAKIPVGTEIYHVNESFGDDFIPAGFVKDKITYDGKEFVALRFEKADIKLVSLYNDDNAAQFYIYDEVGQTFYPFVQLEIGEGKYLIPVLLNDSATFKGFEEIKLTLNEKEVEAWKLDQDFSVIRAYNQDGAEMFYRYDSVDGLLQRYTEPVEPPVVEEPVVEVEKTFLEEYALYIVCILGALVLVLVITLICVLCSAKHKRAVAQAQIQKRREKQAEQNITKEFEE